MIALVLAALKPFIGTLIAGVLNAVFGLLTTYLNNVQQQNIGATVEAARVSATTAKTQVAIAQAEASAPRTLTDTIAALNNGTF